jgi:hypothetical protein
MLNLIFAAALAGAIITSVALWRYGVVVALIGASFGASFLALIVAMIYSFRKKHQSPSAKKSVSVRYSDSQNSQVDR